MPCPGHLVFFSSWGLLAKVLCSKRKGAWGKRYSSRTTQQSTPTSISNWRSMVEWKWPVGFGSGKGAMQRRLGTDISSGSERARTWPQDSQTIKDLSPSWPWGGWGGWSVYMVPCPVLPTPPWYGGGPPYYWYLLFIWNMFCCRLACHDTLEVPQYNRGRRG